MATTKSHLALSAASDEGDEDRSQKLIAAAHELLDEAGLEGLTIRAVLARTGLARRAFYERFQSKDDLVLAVFDTTLRSAARAFEAMTKPEVGSAQALEGIVRGIVVGQAQFQGKSQDRSSVAAQGMPVGGAHLRSAALSREHLRLAQQRPAELKAALQPLLDLMAGHIGKGMAAGVFRQADPQLQARLIYNLVSTTVHTLLLEEEGRAPDRAEREALAQAIWSFCLRAIAA
ncbi:TetR/AcrR family transcriptional regulator [Novosphingobium sp. KA1]|uniref:TetR/AcrR family transcriptional regulator n=1 Tax=Novosphingobium sp. (strain KA1) TaxID=164608 RepID=UPI001A8DDF7A|nr:TetR family transcriptional regulator [Novosphingobium sp. KA1]QSR17881.1 TetR family transcriptional regulator [Novosphingobium sp. KA1]